MTAITLPLFPLELTVFPQEVLALHIFEDRYQQLVRDCETEGITFGIPTFLNNKLEYGTEVVLEDVVKRYPSGACDILCRGLKVFKLQDFYKTLGDKLYAGGMVQYLEETKEKSSLLKSTFVGLVTDFYKELDMKTPQIDNIAIDSFTVSHKLGLTLEEEYKLLQITSEQKRYQYLIKHLNNIIPTIRNINRTKELILLNGHFKNFDPLDFEDYKG